MKIYFSGIASRSRRGSCQNGQALGSNCILFSVLLQHYNVGRQNSLLWLRFHWAELLAEHSFWVFVYRPTFAS